MARIVFNVAPDSSLLRGGDQFVRVRLSPADFSIGRNEQIGRKAKKGKLKTARSFRSGRWATLMASNMCTLLFLQILELHVNLTHQYSSIFFALAC
jgi:hypothetical protein